MAKGIPLMGRDPTGTAKIINVDENGNVKVQQVGTVVDILLEINDRTQTTSIANVGTSISTSTLPLDISGYKDVGIFLNNIGAELC